MTYYDLTRVIDPKTIDLDMLLDKANANDPSALFLCSYFLGAGFDVVTIDEDSTVEWAKRGAEIGLTNNNLDYFLCMVQYGILVEKVGGTLSTDQKPEVRQYIRPAIDRLTAAANEGHPYAQTMLGLMLRDKISVPQNRVRAVKLLEAAAHAGEPTAKIKLAYCCEHNYGTQRDLGKMFRLDLEAAEQNHAQAQVRVARSYDEGFGVRKDLDQAYAWYLKAAKQGESAAMMRLGEKLAGPDVPSDRRDFEQAYQWWEKAAPFGHVMAQIRVAECLAKGLGVDQDRAQAYALYTSLLARDGKTRPTRAPNDTQKRVIYIKMGELRGLAELVNDDETGEILMEWSDGSRVRENLIDRHRPAARQLNR